MGEHVVNKPAEPSCPRHVTINRGAKGEGSETRQDLMLPYFVFRSQEGYTLYVSALKPEWLKKS